MTAAPDVVRAFLERAAHFAATALPPYDSADIQAVCGAAEAVLLGLLRGEPDWPPCDWLDGIVGISVAPSPSGVVIRAAVWVNAVRCEPCEIEVTLSMPHFATIRLSDAAGPSAATAPAQLRFRHREWHYVFECAAPSR